MKLAFSWIFQMSNIKDDTILCHVETDDELRTCFPVMLQLRPHLRDDTDFVDRVNRQREQGYRLFAVWRRGRPLALAGYRLQENLVHGRFLYVDDLIVSKNCRRYRWGARLLEELDEITRQQGCAKLILDTAVSNALAQRFYFRQGMLMGALRFSKPVVPRP